MSLAQPSFLDDRDLRLLLFGGKGGVGKTTCATATALKLARQAPEASFLLVSTDPAHSLVDSLAGGRPPTNLKILELNAQECLLAFKAQHAAKLREIASRGTFLNDDEIGQLLDLSLPGLDELMAFLEISRWVEDGSYDCIVVDTAPTGHTLRLLAMPALIRRWLGVLDALLAKHRYMKRLFSGSYRRDELDLFLEELTVSVKQVETLLRNPIHCRFVPVTLAETLSLSETVTFVEELKGLKVPVACIVVNRLHPDSICPVCASERDRQRRELRNLFPSLSGHALWGIPLYPVEVCGLESLGVFWEKAEEIHEPEPVVPVTPVAPPPKVEAPAAHPSAETTLLLFAGKGGVGKTTLACATAIRLARELQGKNVLLFSTDPAHSLSACLEVAVGPTPTRVDSGLTAVEIDAEAEFDALKHEYSRELKKFLDSLLPNLDLAYDGQVMERILDLSPPGLDEVMALTRVMEFLARHEYDVLILDAAPTGHLIRLLEMPELIDEWLKVFFGLFLKYKQIFRLPKVSQRLVEMSKELKCLQRLLRDPARSALYPVTILTEMAFQETKDLIGACERMGIAMPVLFLNLATPASECPLCSALYRRESLVRDKFQQLFSRQHAVLVYRQGEPRGLQPLGELGRSLYRPDRKDSIRYVRAPKAERQSVPARL